MFIYLKYCSGRQSHTVFPVVGLLHPVLSSPQEELKLLGARWDLTPTRHTSEAWGSRHPPLTDEPALQKEAAEGHQTQLTILSTRQERVRLPFLVAKAGGNVASGAY